MLQSRRKYIHIFKLLLTDADIHLSDPIDEPSGPGPTAIGLANK